MYYGGIDRSYGELSYEEADFILDLIDTYIEILETLEQEPQESE